MVAAVAEARLVTLTGTGGIGKTRVAIQAMAELAGRFPGGVAYADLAPVSDPGLVAVTLLRALGMTPASAATAEDQLVAVLRPRRVLLVIDNIEHLIEEGPLLARLLAGPRSCICWSPAVFRWACMGSTRCGCRRSGCATQAASAADSEAVQLFLQRAEAASPGFRPSDDAAGGGRRGLRGRGRPAAGDRAGGSLGAAVSAAGAAAYYCRRDCPC